MNKRIKPDLVDAKIIRKLNHVVNPSKDYWEPTKNVFKSFYENYIKPNFYFFLFVIIFLFFLLYRYKMVRDEKIEEEISDFDKSSLHHFANGIENYQQYYVNYVNEPQARPIIERTYTDILFDAYNKSKELSYEPKINTSKKKNKIGWAQYDKEKHSNYAFNQKPQMRLAYPVYPYIKGGTLKR